MYVYVCVCEGGGDTETACFCDLTLEISNLKNDVPVVWQTYSNIDSMHTIIPII